MPNFVTVVLAKCYMVLRLSPPTQLQILNTGIRCLRSKRPLNNSIFATGAPFQWAAIFHKEDIKFVHGARGLRFYNSGKQLAEHILPCKVSCDYCGSRIMDEGRNMALIFPGLINFKNQGGKEKFVAR